MHLVKKTLRDCSIVGAEKVNKVLAIGKHHGLLLALDGKA